MKKIGFILLFPLLGSLGGFFVAHNVETWYAIIAKPSFTPPGYLFGPVWNILYALMGYYFAKLLELPAGKYKKNLIFIFWSQFILNIAWTPVFFGAKSILGGLIIISLLLFTIAYMIFYGLKGLRKPSYLMIPYFIWTAFATALNLGIYILN